MESVPQFPTFDEWFHHMQSHNHKWYQVAFTSQSWNCNICELSDVSYSSRDALLSHLKQQHSTDFPAETLESISRQTKYRTRRPSEECLICSLYVEDMPGSRLPSGKRKNDTATNRPGKRARKGLSAARPQFEKPDSSQHNASGEGSSNSVLIDDSASDEAAWRIHRHISGHLQSLMLWTIRLISLQQEESTISDQDIKSDIVDIDSSVHDDGTTSGISDIGRVSDIEIDDDPSNIEYTNDVFDPNPSMQHSTEQSDTESCTSKEPTPYSQDSNWDHITFYDEISIDEDQVLQNFIRSKNG